MESVGFSRHHPHVLQRASRHPWFFSSSTPPSLRQQLGLESGTRFIVMGEDDVIILKRPSHHTPSMRDFDRMIAKARRRQS